MVERNGGGGASWPRCRAKAFGTPRYGRVVPALAESARPDADAALLDERVRQLRESIAPDVYEPTDFIPRHEVEQRLIELTSDIDGLQRVVDTGMIDEGSLAAALTERPAIAEVLQLLFVAPAGAGFADGRELPEHPVQDPEAISTLASLAVDLGLGWLAPPGASVRDLARHGLVALDSRRRGFRRRDSIDDRVNRLMKASVETVRSRVAASIELESPARWPQARGRVRTMILADGIPVAGVAVVLQAQSGGRQQRDLTVTFPQLQVDLDEIPCSLLLIVDGRGIRDAGPRTLRTLIGSVAACLSLEQVDRGELADAIISAVVNRGARESADTAVEGLIGAQLQHSEAVHVAELPVPAATATLSIARYAAARPELALRLSGDTLRWAEPKRVARAQSVTARPERDPTAIAALLADLLNLRDRTDVNDDRAPATLIAVRGTAPIDPVLPPEIVVGATAERVEEQFVRDFARTARRASADASVALLVAASANGWRSSSAADALRSTLATSVVVIDIEELVALAGAVSPRDQVVRTVLEQADLTKANPFNTTGATPRQMFFGRDEEEGRLRGLLRTNSAALIGGRRIGKTSLLQASLDLLDSERWQTCYADCQEASNWATFVAHVASRWGVHLDEQFRPSLLGDMVDQLADGSNRPLVIALDEVDGLLRWDLELHGGGVSETMFRACRALSQEGRCQFVFSGERLLAERLWDPSSPHWNFCLPVPVKQLDRPAAGELVTQPLTSLGVTIDDPARFAQLCWDRTHGHPQVLQHLGDMLVRRLNERPPSERTVLGVSDVDNVTNSGEFRRHYLVTYWGQANAVERLLSALVAAGSTTIERLRVGLREAGAPTGGRELLAALQMLDLYGIVDMADEGATLRAKWLGDAMRVVGGPEAIVEDYGTSSGPQGAPTMTELAEGAQ